MKGYDHFMNRDQRPESNDSMIQMFGHEASSESRSFDVEDIRLPSVEGKETKGFLIIAIVVLVASAILIGKEHYISAGIGVLLGLLIYLMGRKVRYRYTTEDNFRVHNFTVTLRELLRHYTFTSALIDQSGQIIVYSLVLMSVQRILLFSIAPLSFLYAVGFYGFILGVFLNLANRKTQLLRKMFFLNTLVNAVFLLESSFFAGSLDGFTVLSMWVTWYFVGFFESLKITNPK